MFILKNCIMVLKFNKGNNIIGRVKIIFIFLRKNTFDINTFSNSYFNLFLSISVNKICILFTQV